MGGRERRKSPRVDVELPIILEGADGEVRGKTLNISASGIYFELSKYIEPMTKLRMGLAIPLATENGKEGIVQFDGIVVRTEPETESEETKVYKMAVFFTKVPDSSMGILSKFISTNL
ncbi:MAG: PilZ domain-containing protein [Candidatus Krumholzibacteria bacterium]|nr:PilZ domain-containing protein [Candidatus Krumholzibacteria bacterium]